jgi:molecular chaperone DnaJ
VTFPSGIDSGNRLRVVGEGDAGFNGGRPGDFYFLVKIKIDSVFSRQGNNLYMHLPITFSQAVLGDEVHIKTFDSEERVRIPPEVQQGHIIKLKGKGFHEVNRWSRGDLLIELHIVTPEKVSKKEIELFKELRQFELSRTKKMDFTNQ